MEYCKIIQENKTDSLCSDVCKDVPRNTAKFEEVTNSIV